MLNYAEISQIMIPVFVTYNLEAKDEHIRSFMAVLGDYPRIVVYRASINWMRESPYFPKPSELKTQCDLIFQSGWSPPSQKSDEEIMWKMAVSGKNDPDKFYTGDPVKNALNPELYIGWMKSYRGIPPGGRLSDEDMESIRYACSAEVLKY